MAIRLYRDGGKCCGIRCLEGFGSGGPTPNRLRELDTCMARGASVLHEQTGETYIISEGDHGPNENHLITAVLTDDQLSVQDDGRRWGDVLTDKGFKLVTRFTNRNSRGNVVNVFHCCRRMNRSRENRPVGTVLIPRGE